MNLNNKTVTEEEKTWTAFLNGEPGSSDRSDLDEKEKADLISAWEVAGNNFSFVAANPDIGWSKLKLRIEEYDRVRKISIFKSHLFRYAAILVMVAGIGFAAYQVVRPPKIAVEATVVMNVMETSAHPVTVTQITLPDGSTVKLNANTKIEFPEHFASNLRKIKLSGEAFFEVTKDSAHPFLIETENASVEVLGTSFNVSAYPDSERVEVNVETGKVKLTRLDKGESFPKFAILPAGERGWLKVSGGEVCQAKTLAPNFASWLTKRIRFQHTPLAEVCTVLENTYHLKFRLENPEIGKIPYTANFEDLNPDYIIDVIARTHHLRVKKSGEEIIFANSVN